MAAASSSSRSPSSSSHSDVGPLGIAARQHLPFAKVLQTPRFSNPFVALPIPGGLSSSAASPDSAASPASAPASASPPSASASASLPSASAPSAFQGDAASPSATAPDPAPSAAGSKALILLPRQRLLLVPAVDSTPATTADVITVVEAGSRKNPRVEPIPGACAAHAVARAISGASGGDSAVEQGARGDRRVGGGRRARIAAVPEQAEAVVRARLFPIRGGGRGGVGEVDKLKAKFIAGRIILLIATTTTALATSLVCLELYKVLQGAKASALRNTFANLALPLFSMAEPVLPKSVKHKELTWTVWDRWTVEGDVTMQELLDWFSAKGLDAYRRDGGKQASPAAKPFSTILSSRVTRSAYPARSATGPGGGGTAARRLTAVHTSSPSILLTIPLPYSRFQPGKYTGLRQALVGVTQQHGASQLFRGVVPKLASMVPASAINFLVFESLKDEIKLASMVPASAINFLVFESLKERSDAYVHVCALCPSHALPLCPALLVPKLASMVPASAFNFLVFESLKEDIKVRS
ncbi:unnamed protein product [Closterium sp. Yama58-4]|nr:unnamed protein product [Closterium sp. Yama58-4]